MRKYILKLALFILPLIIPGLVMADGLPLNLSYPEFGGTNLEDGGLDSLAIWLYYAVVGIAGMASFVMIVIAGIERVGAAGNPARISESNDRIKAAFLGLILIFSSFMILNLINPRLTTLEVPEGLKAREDTFAGGGQVLNRESFGGTTIGSGEPFDPSELPDLSNLPDEALPVQFFSQHDPRWANEAYGFCPGYGHTISAAGCGPTSVAMALHYYRDNLSRSLNDPVRNVVAYGGLNNQHLECGQGSYHSLFSGAANHWGLNHQSLYLEPNSRDLNQGHMNMIIEQLSMSRPVIVTGSNPPYMPINTGHIMLITGYDPDREMFYVNDPNKPPGTGTIDIPVRDFINSTGHSSWTGGYVIYP